MAGEVESRAIESSAPTTIAHRVAWQRAGLIVLAALVGAVLVTLETTRWHPGRPSDFDQVWFAARTMWQGRDPYEAIGPGRAFEWTWRYLYPMTASVIALPLAWMPVEIARVLFISGSCALFAWAITRDGLARWPALLSTSFLVSAQAAQWSPLLTAALSIPALGWTLCAKPPWLLAYLAGFATRKNLRVVVLGCLVVGLLSLALQPAWIPAWIRVVRTSNIQGVPLLSPLGPLVLLALRRWRSPDARLLVALALMPQTMTSYSMLPLFLLTRTRVEAMVLALGSVAAGYIDRLLYEDYLHLAAAGWVTTAYVACMFLPALAMVWRRPIESPNAAH